MTEQVGARLDAAYDALRAWCHERPDLQEPSTIYGTFGTVTAIIATLEHIVELASRSAARATSTDDGRAIADSCEQIQQQARAAIQSFEDAYRSVAGAHEITGHLIFAIVDDTDFMT